MTLKDFLKRVDTNDLDKMLLWSDGGIGWDNIEIEKRGDYIYIKPSMKNSPFTSDN